MVVRSLVPDPLTKVAIAQIRTWERTDVSLIAPALFTFEVTSSLRRMVYLKQISPQDGEDAFSKFQRMPVRISHRSQIFQVAWEMAKDLNRPRAYDTAYLAVSRLHECDFWTADKRIYNAVHDRLAWVKLLSDTE